MVQTDAVTTDDFPITWQSNERLGTLILAGGACEQVFKLGHLLAKHGIKHRLLVTHLLTELFLERVLKALQGGCLCRDGLFKMNTLLMNLSSDFLKLSGRVMSLLLRGICKCFGLVPELLKLGFQRSNLLVSALFSVNFHS